MIFQRGETDFDWKIQQKSNWVFGLKRAFWYTVVVLPRTPRKSHVHTIMEQPLLTLLTSNGLLPTFQFTWKRTHKKLVNIYSRPTWMRKSPKSLSNILTWKPAEYTKRTQYSFSLTYPTTDTNQVSNSVVFRIGWIGLGLVGIGCVLSQN